MVVPVLCGEQRPRNRARTYSAEQGSSSGVAVAERVCVFIDGSNFYHMCKESLDRTDVDLGAFAGFLVGSDRTLVRTYYYTCKLPPDHPEPARQAKEKFLGALDRVAYLEVRLGKLVSRTTRCRSCNAEETRYTEKGVDMHIGVDMLSGASKSLYDTAVLVTGDADLVDAVKAVKDLGKHVEVAAFARGRARELVQAADVLRDLTPTDMAGLYLR